MSALQREFTSDLSELGKMRGFVRETCQKAWGPDNSADAINSLVLAVGEAIVNIILHAYERQAGQRIELVLEVDDHGASIWLSHSGRNFDPAKVPQPKFDGSKENGFGVYLIQQVVDDIQYFQDERGKCVVKLYKKRESPPQKE